VPVHVIGNFFRGIPKQVFDGNEIQKGVIPFDFIRFQNRILDADKLAPQGLDPFNQGNLAEIFERDIQREEKHHWIVQKEKLWKKRE